MLRLEMIKWIQKCHHLSKKRRKLQIFEKNINILEICHTTAVFLDPLNYKISLFINVFKMLKNNSNNQGNCQRLDKIFYLVGIFLFCFLKKSVRDLIFSKIRKYELLKAKQLNLFICEIHSPLVKPHQWPSGSVIKTGRREMQGSISGRFCLPSCLEFSVVSPKLS